MRSVYDAILFTTCLWSSRGTQTITDTTLYTSAAIDTKGYNSAVLRAHGGMDNSSCTTFPIAVLLTECATSGGSYAAANDNSGTQIQINLDVHAGDADGYARIEGLNVNRLRYFKVTAQAGSITGGSSPASKFWCELALGRAYQLPTNTTTSNT